MNLTSNNISKSYSFIRKVYIFVYIILVIQRAWGPMEIITPAKVDAAIFFVLSFTGIILILYDLLHDKISLKTPNNTMLCLFILSVLISSILNITYGNFSDNINSIVLLSIEFFVFYAINLKRDKKDILKEICQIEHLIMIIWFLASITSLVMFLKQSSYYIELPHKLARIGVVENRLFGIFTDPNYAAVTSIILIVLSIKNFINFKQIGIRIFYIINIAIQFIYIILSGSRTADVTLAVVVLLMSYFTFRYIFYDKNMSKIKNLFFSVGFSILLLIAVLCLYILLKKLLAYIPAIFTNSVDGSIQPVSFMRDDVENNTDISNLRFRIWNSAIELFKSSPLFGVSVKSVIPYAILNFPLGFIAEKKCAIHSFYVTTITCTGIVGASLIFGFIVKNVIKVTKTIFKINEKEQYFNILYSFLPVVALLCSGFFLSEIIFVNTIGSIIFWLYLGYTVYFMTYKNKDINLPVSYKVITKFTSKLKK